MLTHDDGRQPIGIGQLNDPGERKRVEGFLNRQGYLKQSFSISSTSLCCYHIPYGNGVALYLNKLEPPLTKITSCQVWLKMRKVCR